MAAEERGHKPFPPAAADPHAPLGTDALPPLPPTPGHSMGGMLATGAMSLQGALSRHVRSIVMLGSGCFGAGSWHSLLRPFVSVLCWPGFHGVLAGAVVGRLVRTHTLSLVESAFYWRSNTQVGRGAGLGLPPAEQNVASPAGPFGCPGGAASPGRAGCQPATPSLPSLPQNARAPPKPFEWNRSCRWPPSCYAPASASSRAGSYPSSCTA
jgi:pimeloyl-ACP methyl ester carboxylesterase